MNRKTLGLGIAAVVAAGVLSTSAFALTVFGNNSQKGSLLIYPLIQVGTGADTLITLTNDSSVPVLLKCYYATSDPVPTPNGAPASGLRGLKHFEDFTINVTHNQPIAWWASSGLAYSNSQQLAGAVAPPFGTFPDGQRRDAGELKCWAITDDGATQKSHNHLYGTASIFFTDSQQANEYTAWAFQSFGAPESASASPGVLNLNNVDYDACPNILLGNFLAASPGTANPIGGGISFSDGFDALPGAGSTTIVSQLTLLDVQTSANVFSTSGGFAGVGALATTTDIATSGPAQVIFTTQGVVFTFTGTVSAVVRTAPTCVSTTPSTALCSDQLSFALNGTVTGGGFDATPFSGNWTGNGSCTANLAGQCQSAITGSWSSSLVATGTAVGGHGTLVKLASCNQDLRQAYTPTITKLTWTFFNQDEEARTGTHTCADSWFEADFPSTAYPFATFAGLGTEVGYFRIQTTADTQICGPSAVTSAYVGVIEQAEGPGFVRGTNLTGRGPANGVIKYDVSPPDSFRPSH